MSGQSGTDRSAGTFVTESFPYDSGRQVTVYVPPDPPTAIVYAADGQFIAPWGRDLESASGVPPTMIVGPHQTGVEEGKLRLREYSPDGGGEIFEAHKRFFVDDVRDWVRSRFAITLPPERTAVYGASAGGELALTLGLRHPEIYGAVLCASPGDLYPPAVIPNTFPRTYLVAGAEEPWFLDNATRWADALRAAGIDTLMTVRPGEHGDEFWRTEFPLMLAWAFPDN